MEKLCLFERPDCGNGVDQRAGRPVLADVVGSNRVGLTYAKIRVILTMDSQKATRMNTSEVEHFLNRHGVKPTPQRMVIAEFVLNAKSHPTADQVFQEVAEKLPVLLSRATVYNTLNTLVEAGAIREVYIAPGPARYDANIEEHHHFVDVSTGKVIDIDADMVRGIASELGPDFKVHHYSVTFFGELKNRQS